MSDAHAVSRDQLRSFIERIERLEEEKKTIADDIKDVYGEAKGTGFDTKVLRKLISIRKQDRDERAEQEAILDMYMIALGMVDESTGYDEPRQSEPVERQPAMALRSDTGLNIVTKHTEIAASPETATEVPAQDGGGTALGESHGDKSNAARPASVDAQPNGRGSAGKAEESVVTAGETATNSQSDDGAIAAVNGKAGLANADGVEPSSSDQCAAPEKDAAAGERSVEADGGAALVRTNPKPKVSFRPNCLQPEMCRSGTRDHCYSCRKAMAQHEDAA